MRSMMVQDIEQRQGFCFIDPHGDEAEKLAGQLPQNGVYWNLADPDCSYGYNPLSAAHPAFRPLVASGIIDALKKQWSDAWGVRMEHLLRYSVLALLDKGESNLSEITRMYTDRYFRDAVIEKIQELQVRDFWTKEYPSYNPKSAFDGVAPIANKLGGFLSVPHVKHSLCCPAKPIRFSQILKDGTPLVINLAKGRLGSDISDMVGGLVVSMLSQAAFLRSQPRRPYFLYIDEFHSFTTEIFANMLSELRKYGLGLTLAHQYTNQLDKSVLDAVLGNAGTQIVFRVGASDAVLFTKHLDLSEGVALNRMDNFDYAIRLMVEGVLAKSFTARSIGEQTLQRGGDGTETLMGVK